MSFHQIRIALDRQGVGRDAFGRSAQVAKGIPEVVVRLGIPRRELYRPLAFNQRLVQTSSEGSESPRLLWAST